MRNLGVCTIVRFEIVLTAKAVLDGWVRRVAYYNQVSIINTSIHWHYVLTHAWNSARSVLDLLSHVDSAVDALQDKSVNYAQSRTNETIHLQ